MTLNGQDLSHAVDFTASIMPGTYTSTETGVAVDTANAEEPIIAVIAKSQAASAGTNPTLDFTVEESADGSSNWAEIPSDALINPDGNAADTFDQVTDAADSEQVMGVRTQLCARYLRVVGTIGGTSTPTFSCVALFAFGKLRT